MMRTIFPAVLIATLALCACTPESLEGFGDEETTPSNNQTTTNNTANSGGAQFTSQYLAVHGIVTANCALAGCHGPNSGGGAFAVPAGTNAQPAELQAALSDRVSVSSGDLLVDPSSSATSDLYSRLLASPPLQMPTTGTLPQSDIDTIQMWIDSGAAYTQ